MKTTMTRGAERLVVVAAGAVVESNSKAHPVQCPVDRMILESRGWRRTDEHGARMDD